MDDHPPISIETEHERKDDEPTISNGRTGSLRSTVVTAKKYHSVLPSDDINTLHKQNIPKNPKTQ